VFTARYGLIPYIKQITFGLQKVNKTLIFPKTISANTPIQQFVKILSVGVEFFRVDRRTDGRTDRMKLIVAIFRNFCELAEKRYCR